MGSEILHTPIIQQAQAAGPSLGHILNIRD